MVEQLEHAWKNQGSVQINAIEWGHTSAVGMNHLLNFFKEQYDVFIAFHRLGIQLPGYGNYLIGNWPLEDYKSTVAKLTERKAALQAQQAALFRGMVVGLTEMNAGLSEKRLKLKAQQERLELQLAEVSDQVRRTATLWLA